MKNLDLKVISAKLLSVTQKLKKYVGFMFVILLICIYGFLVFRINTLTSREPDEEALTEKLKSLRLPKIDQAELDKIEQLEDNSEEVQALFNHARENPFSE